jgi:transcriptional coactivator p15 (PC4)
MAYNSTDEKSEELCRIVTSSKKIVARKIENSRGISVDIREYFDNDDGEELPTKKGVRFSSENVAELVKAMLPMMEKSDIMDIMEIATELTE